MAISIQLFQATGEVAQHPTAQVTVPADFKILCGGALDNWNPPGNLLTASYPQSLQTWFAAGKDHEKPSPASLTVFALALNDPLNEWDVTITENTSLTLPHPQATAKVAPGHVLTGGGAFVNYHGYGNLLTASAPLPDQSGWSVASKDHDLHDPSQITAYAIGLRHKSGTQVELRVENTTGGVAEHPTASVCLSDPSFTMCGGGAIDNWSGDGNLLTASFPQGNCWMAAGKDHIHVSPASLTAFVMGIRLL